MPCFNGFSWALIHFSRWGGGHLMEAKEITPKNVRVEEELLVPWP